MRALIIAAGAAALALSACSSPSPTPSASATPTSAVASASATASATPSTSPSPTAAAVACEDEQIVPGRLGCIDTNAAASGNPGASLLAWAPDRCSAGVGRWTYAPNPDLVGVAGHDGPIIGRIDVYDPALTTPEGIHVGSTEAEVTAAYPGTPLTVAPAGTKLLVVTGVEGSYVIELADGWGAEPQFTVANIRIYASGVDANYAVYGTEDFAAACPMDI